MLDGSTHGVPKNRKGKLTDFSKTLKQVHFLRGFHAEQLLAFQWAMTVFSSNPMYF